MPVKPASNETDIFDDDDEGWQEMPVVRESDAAASGLDEEDQKRYHYVAPAKKTATPAGAGNATGTLLDYDDAGAEWREKAETNEGEYTRLRMQEEDEGDEVHLRTRYLFDDNKAMTPLSQMQATKDLLTEAQRIAYVGVCALTAKEMAHALKIVKSKELKPSIKDMELWALKIMGRIYYHMELATEEQKMIDSLSEHGVQAADLAPALMTTQTVANPEFDPAAARKRDEEQEHQGPDYPDTPSAPTSQSTFPSITSPSLAPPSTPGLSIDVPGTPTTATSNKSFQTTPRILEETTVSVPGVSTTLSNVDKDVTLDIRWTVLCDLFLILIADSVYDARSRVLLEHVALQLGLGWLDVVKFERRITEALEIQENVEKMEQQEVVEGRQKSSMKRRYVMMGLATLGGGLVIGLSAGLLAPVIGAGLGAALGTVGITGTTAFLGGAGGAAMITTGGVLTGSSIAVRGMARRTQLVKTFDILPLHNNRRVNVILTIPGFMTSLQDDVRLPFSVLDPVVGDVFSVLWEPEMIQEAGSALKILTGEVLTQLAQTALQATVMTALMSALQWPLILTKLGYLIDNPWSNALDRAKAAGGVLADVLIQRHLGVRPITLIGFSLGARVIFYALLELARQKAFGIVQDVILLGTTVTAPTRTWHEARSAVSGRFVNGYARNDWVLNYLFRATSGGLHTVAGLRPVDNVPGLDNVDVTDKIAGHMSYRTFMPLILDQLGFPVTADFFDDPEEPDFIEERIVVREGEELPKKRGWFSRAKTASSPTSSNVSRPPTAANFPSMRKRTPSSTATPAKADDDALPPRISHDLATGAGPSRPPSRTQSGVSNAPPEGPVADPTVAPAAPVPRAGFNFQAIKEVIGQERQPGDPPLSQPLQHPGRFPLPPILPPSERSESVPPLTQRAAVTTAPADFSRPASPSTFAHGYAGAVPRVIAPGSSSPSVAGDLHGRFARSVSLSDIRAREGDHDTIGSPAAFPSSSSAAPFAESHPGRSGSTTAAPTLSTFDGGLTPLGWGASSAEDMFNPGGGYGSARGASRSQASSSSMVSFGADPSEAAGTSMTVPPFGASALHNPFGGGSEVGAAGLTFGGADGSITSAWGGGAADPWTAGGAAAAAAAGKGQSKARGGGFGSNPWQ